MNVKKRFRITFSNGAGKHVVRFIDAFTAADAADLVPYEDIGFVAQNVETVEVSDNRVSQSRITQIIRDVINRGWLPSASLFELDTLRRDILENGVHPDEQRGS